MGTHPIFESDFDCLTDAMSRGVSRIEQRLKSKIDSGGFYEAHQMYRTIASRYKTGKKIGDALALTHDGAIVLYEKDQNGSASDLGLLFCSMLDEATELSPKIIEFIKGLHRRTIEKLDEEQPERDQFEKRILQRSIELSNGDSEDDSEDDAGPGQGIDMNSIMNMANNMISGMVNQGQNRQPTPTQRPQRVAPRASAAPPAVEEDVDDL